MENLTPTKRELSLEHQLEKEGFVRCGIIKLENGDPRIAYQKGRGSYEN